MKNLERIQEIAYLNVENTIKYRAIMRVIYNNHENSNMQMNKEDIIYSLQKEEIELSIDEISPLLSQLVEWGNLGAIIDSKKVRTIEEYKNRSYIYSLTPKSVEIERLTLKLESLFIESNTLNPSLFKRLLESIKDIRRYKSFNDKELNEWWRNLSEDFKRLNQNYLDFIHQFYNSKTEMFFKSLEFIVYKDRFIDYLRTFVKELKDYQRSIEIELIAYTKEEIDDLLNNIIRTELELPRSNTENMELIKESVNKSIRYSFENIYNWFVSINSRECEAFKIYDKANEIIKKIITNINILVNTNTFGETKKEDYRALLKLFNEAKSIDEVKEISTFAFGISNTQHYFINKERETESTNSSVYDEKPQVFELKPISKAYKARMDKEGFNDNSLEILLELNKHNKKSEEEKLQVLKIMKDGIIDLSLLDETVNENLRKIILTWIGTSNINNTNYGTTSFGEKFEIIRSDERVDLLCEDGILNMPAYKFKFEGLINE